jgi:hypothetical protein
MRQLNMCWRHVSHCQLFIQNVIRDAPLKTVQHNRTPVTIAPDPTEKKCADGSLAVHTRKHTVAGLSTRIFQAAPTMSHAAPTIGHAAQLC